ncbi:hypothetical protein D030_5300A, partial [Vibrio parahaemolyticus AQ3810]
MYSLDSN